MAEKNRDNAARSASDAPPAVAHGSPTLTAVTVDASNSQMREEDGFVGDRARRAAFFQSLDRWREIAGDAAPLGETATADISKRQIDDVLMEGDPVEQAVILSAVEEYAGELATVVRRLLRTKEWRGTERIAIGGGLKAGRFAEIAIARAELIARSHDTEIELRPIRHHPDEAGLIGAVHLAPSWMFANFGEILAVDIGGTNIRAGIVRLNLDKAEDLSKAKVRTSQIWRHGDEDPKRDMAIERLAKMLKDLVGEAEEEKLSLAPFIGVGCPGVIQPDGSIAAGAQNLPGNWESSRFNLPAALWQAIPEIGGRETTVVVHNDAVVQGLSEVPLMQDVTHWGVLTIGTGLGNARFTTRARPNDERKAVRRKNGAGGD
ncbi:ROK family protein [Ancylobacter sp. VKM B-3255]|uniref:ROK family protein n=2 Tax=Ancylobacter radicis TaxID=2836179 RepID=A0ABS5R6A8_9HYPH|nr:ROK family protein [Ancylobacter radicis]MBS9477203.1 ROK family protein [Ancylobacter radicis]